MKLSVIITTYNNEDTIAESLDSYINQSLDSEHYEIVVVSDGSTDRTNEIVEEYHTRHPFISLVQQANLGVAAARNTGLKASSSIAGSARADHNLVLFTQADITADPNLLEQHFRFHFSHLQKEYALVGYTTWHPDITVTPFMRWLEHGGPQFDFDHLNPDKVTDFLSFYTTNLSLKRNFLLENGGFDVHFKGENGVTAYEDTELGYRLQKQGMQLYYQPKALAYHKHIKDLSGVLNRRYYEGMLSHRLLKKHPDLEWDRKLSDKQLFWLTIWVLNPIVMFLFLLIAYYVQDKLYFPLLYKLVARTYYNWGFGVGYGKM